MKLIFISTAVACRGVNARSQSEVSRLSIVNDVTNTVNATL